MSTLKEEFQDREYRRAYAESLANTIIATQLRLLRGQMTQAQFADLVGMKQSRVSAMEDENYSAWSTKSLKRVAAKNDVVFLGHFVSFGELLDLSRRLSEKELRVKPFSDDPAFRSKYVETKELKSTFRRWNRQVCSPKEFYSLGESTGMSAAPKDIGRIIQQNAGIPEPGWPVLVNKAERQADLPLLHLVVNNDQKGGIPPSAQDNLGTPSFKMPVARR